MTAQAITRPRPDKGKLRTARKINRKRVIELIDQGVSVPVVAASQQVAPTTIYRFLEKIDKEKQSLIKYKSGRADHKALLQLKTEDKIHIIMETITDDSVKAMSDSSKKGFLDVLNNISGTAYDKERLERGQSTQNIAYDNNAGMERYQALKKLLTDAIDVKTVDNPVSEGSCQPHDDTIDI